ncbi:MAG TPA: GNAT family N-acetyltransferase [Candidatus Limiplasma sp.]|nr:GNAT family N-acetyltransferase [Candidatus Limiplasma sp.]HRX08332.1 GNAT family N-acetyltransferase [Candidatus Limiplasma sp.]
MIITQPTADALPEICALYQTVIADMHARGLFQWHWGWYPYEALLKEDIALGRLYRMDDEDGLAGVFALVTGGQEPEYRDVGWQLGDNPVCLHRIAVLPGRGGRGYAAKAVEFAKDYGRSVGCNAFRVDTYTDNIRALKFFQSVTTRKAGTFTLEGFDKLYHCFEAAL